MTAWERSRALRTHRLIRSAAICSSYSTTYTATFAAPAPALNIKTGGNIPSPLVAELDRKLDDGEPQTGAFRFSSFDGSTASCITGAPVKHNASLNITTCGGAQLQ